MPRVIVVGGGFAGCGAAIASANQGVEVELIERTNHLLGAAGYGAGDAVHANGRAVAEDELDILGAPEIHNALRSLKIHDADLPGDSHSFIYHVGLSEPAIRALIQGRVNLHLNARAVDIVMQDNRISAVNLQDGTKLQGDAFIDATGHFGGVDNCEKYGKGCVICFYECPAYGDRVSIAGKAGVTERARLRSDGTPGAVGAAIYIFKETLSSTLRKRLEDKGVQVIPIPREFVDYERQLLKGPRHRANKINAENIILVDIGHLAKCHGIVFFPLDQLRKIEGFENAVVANPMNPSYNWIDNLAMCPRDDALKVEGLDNLYVAGGKSGPYGGLTETIVTGTLAGYNAASASQRKTPLVLPRTLAIGDFITFTGEKMKSDECTRNSYSFGRGEFFERMKQRDLYPSTKEETQRRVEEEGLTGVFGTRRV